MPTSPSVLNYFIGKGTLSFTPSGGSARALGNAPTFEVVPTIEKLDHFSSMEGIKSKDRSVTVSVSGTVNIVLDEITKENLAMALFGDPEENSAGDNAFDILGTEEIEGSLTFVGTNSVGNKFTVVVNSVSFTPSAGFNFISEEFGEISLTGEMAKVNGSFGTVTKTADAS